LHASFDCLLEHAKKVQETYVSRTPTKPLLGFEKRTIGWVKLTAKEAAPPPRAMDSNKFALRVVVVAVAVEVASIIVVKEDVDTRKTMSSLLCKQQLAKRKQGEGKDTFSTVGPSLGGSQCVATVFIGADKNTSVLGPVSNLQLSSSRQIKISPVRHTHTYIHFRSYM
jgi:hypothetical protein